MWVRQWILRRPEHGLYDKLMVELRNEDPRAFQHFMRMPPAMFDEVVQRLTPRLTKQDTNYRAGLEPGLKVAITLRHLASGNTYKNTQYVWRVPHNTISVVVREVVKAIIEECTDELVFCPTTEQGWRDLDGTFPTQLVSLMASTWPVKLLVTLAQNSTTTKAFTA